MPRGRPKGATKKKTAEKRQNLLGLFCAYIQETDYPIVAEFAYKNGFARQKIYEWPGFTDALELCNTKKRAYLERRLLEKEPANKGGIIFALKNVAKWSDHADVNMTITPVDITMKYVGPNKT